MGVKRKGGAHHLPPGVYESKGQVFWRDPDTGKWQRLGKEWDSAAKKRWIELSTGKAAEGTISELIDAFLKHCEEMVRTGERSPNTHEVNLLEAGKLKEVFGAMHYGDINSKHCAVYLNKRREKATGRLTPIRANREIAFLSSAYSWAMRQDQYEVTSNPCYGVRRNKEKPRDRYVATWELRKFTKEFAPTWLRCYCVLKRLVALRLADMLKLTDKSFTARGLETTTGKTKRPIIIRWSWALRKVVAAAQDLRPKLPENVATLMPRPLFPCRYGTAYSTRGFKTAWQRCMSAYAAAGNARFWEHDIRAKSGSDAESDQRAQELLGHESVATTRRHYRRAPAKVRPLR
jgi:integrase